MVLSPRTPDMPQSHEIEARLSSIWEALARESHTSRLVVNGPSTATAEDDRRIVLPLGLDDASRGAGVLSQDQRTHL